MIPNVWDTRKGIDDWYEKSNTTWGNILNIASDVYKEVEAIIYKDVRLNFFQLRRHVDIFARGLLEIGIRPGDSVALWMTNCPEWVTSQFAIYKIGARLVPINTRYCLNELEYVLNQSDCKALIMNDMFLGKTNAMEMIEKVMSRRGCKEEDNRNNMKLRHIICLTKDGIRHKDTLAYHDVVALGDKHGSDALLKKYENQVSPSDVMSIQYTSGTTGFPKGVMCTHRSNLASFLCTGIGFGYRNGKDRMIVSLPFFTNYGVLGCSATSILFGVTMVVMEQYDPEECLRLIEKEKITISHGSDNMYINIMKHDNYHKYNISSLRGGLMGGGHNPIDVIKEVMKIVPEISLGYGLTENSGFGSMALYDDPMEKRLHTSGRPIPYTKMCIKDINTNAIMPNGNIGEICTHDVLPNSSVMIGYYKKDKETRESIDIDGWLHTGDLGYLDEDGYLIVTGRLKDMFTAGGNNVYPAEIENYLYSHPQVKHVAVVGIPDEVKGSIPMAYVVRKTGAKIDSKEIIDYCRNNIASYKVPRYVEFIDELPLTSSGKVQKFELKERAIKKLGLEEISRKRKM